MAEKREKIYAIGGLGADQRVFQSLDLKAELHVLKWEKSAPKESLSDYALRMSKQIETGFEGWLIGVSFGGIVAQEIAKLKPVKVMLISSASKRNELHMLYRFIGKTGLITTLPTTAFRLPSWLAIYLFGANNKKLLSEIIHDTDPSFVKWALQRIVTWKNDKGLFHFRIHGKIDRLFPLKNDMYIDCKTVGGHFTIVDEGAEISDAINAQLAP